MKKILGLDLGTNSIGWAVLESEDGKHPNNLLECGVRIFEDIKESKTEETKNKKRREARGSRRVLHRKNSRIKRLVRLLQNKGMLPSDSAEKDKFYREIEPYEVRAKAIKEKVGKKEIARALLHLAKRRGFRSNRKTEFHELLQSKKYGEEIKKLIEAEEKEKEPLEKNQNKEENSKKTEEKKTLKAISELQEKLVGRTIGEYFFEINKKQKKKIRETHTERTMYEEEFKRIWEEQEKHYPQLLTSEFKEKIKGTIFFQRPLKIQKFLVGGCSLERNKKRIYKAHPAFQEFQIWQTINNLEVEGEPLEQEQKEKLFDKLQNQKQLSWGAFRKLFGFLENTQINLEKSIKKLSGNFTQYTMKKHFPDFWENLTAEKQKDFIADCLSINKKTTLYKRLKEKYPFSKKEAFDFVGLDLAALGYGSLSLKAINKILPHLKKGKNYYDARQAGYQLEDSIQEKKRTKLPYIPQLNEKGGKNTQKVNNPVVIKALNELRKIVNALIEKHGDFATIRVELTRDLKNGKAKRKEIKQRQNKRNTERENAKKEIEKEGKTPNRGNIEKYLLWKECKNCPYTGKNIGINDLFSSSIDIDHIIPFSRSLDNSFMNKTLCFAEENRNIKKNKTPYETYHNNKEKWEQLQQRVFKLRWMPYWKKKRFFMKPAEVEKLLDNFTTRHLNDTRYISRLAKEHLQFLNSNVEVAQGTLTAYLRRMLGFEKDRTEDHRHHTVDAIMVALTTHRLLQKITELSQRNKEEKLLIPDYIKNNFSVSKIQPKTEKVIVSHAKSKDEWLKGALHEETAYGKVKKAEEKKLNKYYTRRVTLENLTPAQVKKISDKYVKELVREWYQEGKKGELIHQNGNPINKVRLLENLSEDGMIPISKGQKEDYKYYPSGNNHHCIIFENLKTGKKEGEVISTWRAKEREKKGEPIIQKDRKDCKYLFHFKINDMFSLTKEGEEKYYRVQSFDKNKIIVFREHQSAKVENKGEARKTLIQCRIKTIFDYSPKKLQINPLGEITKTEEFSAF